MTMTRHEILSIATAHDPNACWVTDEPDEYCLLVLPDGAADLLARVPDAYEDPNTICPTEHTRVVFPSL